MVEIPCLPACPECGTADDVIQLVRLVCIEFRYLDASGTVIEAMEASDQEETGWAWHCTECGQEWGHRGELAPPPDRRALEERADGAAPPLDH